MNSEALTRLTGMRTGSIVPIFDRKGIIFNTALVRLEKVRKYGKELFRLSVFDGEDYIFYKVFDIENSMYELAGIFSVMDVNVEKAMREELVEHSKYIMYILSKREGRREIFLTDGFESVSVTD